MNEKLSFSTASIFYEGIVDLDKLSSLIFEACFSFSTSSWVANHHKAQGTIGGLFPQLSVEVILRLSSEVVL